MIDAKILISEIKKINKQYVKYAITYRTQKRHKCKYIHPSCYLSIHVNLQTNIYKSIFKIA